MKSPRLILALVVFEATFIPLALLSWARPSYFLDHIETFTSGQAGAYFLAAALLLAAYGVILRCLSRGETLPRRAWIGAFACVLLLCLAIPPFLSRDAAGYAIIGRGVLAGSNPYLKPLSELQPAWSSALGPIWWLHSPSMYGPLFDLLAALAMLAPVGSLLAAVFVWKLAGALAFVACVVALKKIVELRRLPAWIVPALAFNPAALIHAVAEGHNDVFVLACLLGAVYLYLKKAHLRGAALIGAAAALKFFPALLLPMYALDGERIRPKLERILTTIAIFLLSAAAFAFPFAAIISNLRLQASLPCLYTCSSIVSAADAMFGAYAGTIRLAAALLLYALIALRFRRSRRTADASAVFAYVFWTLCVFFFVQIRWLAPWYPLLLLPFGLLLSDKRGYLLLTFCLTAFALLQYA